MANTVDVEFENEDVILGHSTVDPSYEASSYERTPLCDLTADGIKAIATGADLQTLHNRNVEVGMVSKSFVAFFEKYKPLVVAMIEKIKAPRGSHRRTMIDGVEYTAATYCKAVYGVSYRHVKSLIDGDYIDLEVPGSEAADDVKSVIEGQEGNGDESEHQIDSPKLSKKDLIIVDLKKQNDALTDQVGDLISKIETITDGRIPNVPEPEEHIPTATAPDPYQTEFDAESMFEIVLKYFRQVRDPYNFMSDINSVIDKCGMTDKVEVLMVEEAEVI